MIKQKICCCVYFLYAEREQVDKKKQKFCQFEKIIIRFFLAGLLSIMLLILLEKFQIRN